MRTPTPHPLVDRPAVTVSVTDRDRFGPYHPYVTEDTFISEASFYRT